MYMNNLKYGFINGSLLFLLSLFWNQAQSCEISQDDSGRTIYTDCFLFEDQPQLKMPNLQVKSASISIALGPTGYGDTGLDIGFEIINSGQADSDRGSFYTGYSYNGGNTMNGGFDVKTVVYAVSEDHSFNMHFDADQQQFVPYSQETHRVNKLVAGDSKYYYFGTAAGLPRFFLRDRNVTYKVGLLIKVDEPHVTGVSTRGVPHGEIVESDESDNNRTVECLVYGYNISDLSEILHIEHFHINNDLELPLIVPCL